MTDQGFKKFRRRRKRDKTPAPEHARPDSLRSDGADIASKRDAAAEVTPENQPAQPAADVPPVPPAQPAAARSDSPVVPRRPVADRVANPAGDTPQKAPVSTRQEPQPLPALDHPPDKDAMPSDDPLASLLTVEEAPSLPAHLPNPWHVMRRVEITGLGQRRSRLPLVDYFRNSPTARAFDLLRTRMLHTLRDHGWKRVAVCAPTSGCGASFTAANLALSLARVPGSRTVLMDMNLRTPGVARALGLDRAALYNGDMPGFLRGETRLEDHLVAVGDSLALGLNTSTCYNAAEVLHEARCAATITEMIRRTEADVALFDLPPVLQNDDVAAFLPQVDGVLLVSDGNQTTAQHLKACEKMLAGHTQLLGVVLNRGRADDGFSSAE